MSAVPGPRLVLPVVQRYISPPRCVLAWPFCRAKFKSQQVSRVAKENRERGNGGTVLLRLNIKVCISFGWPNLVAVSSQVSYYLHNSPQTDCIEFRTEPQQYL